MSGAQMQKCEEWSTFCVYRLAHEGSARKAAEAAQAQALVALAPALTGGGNADGEQHLVGESGMPSYGISNGLL